MLSPSIPELPDDADNLTAAQLYANEQLYLLPIKPGTKHPGSRVGKDWGSKSSCDIETLAAWFIATSDGIALDLGRSGLVVVDVDKPEMMPEWLTTALTESGAPYQSTRPESRGRGHYVFAQPAGRRIGNGKGQLSGMGLDIRGAGGVIIVAPSTHAEGGEYRWIRTGEIPVLPELIADKLTDGTDNDSAATDDEITEFIDSATGTERESAAETWPAKFKAEVEKGNSRHDAMVSILTAALEEANAGYFPARDITEQLCECFIDAMLDDDAGGRKISETQARAEFRSILAWSVGQAKTTPVSKTRRKVETNMAGSFGGNPMTEPTNDSTTDDSTTDPDPIPLTGKMIPVPPFPVDAFPTVYKKKIVEVAEFTQTDPAMAGTSALSALGACAGGHVKVEVKPGWDEPCCIFTATIAKPGERKSPVQKEMTSPLNNAEREMSFAGEIERITKEDEQSTAKKAVDKLEKDYLTAKAKADKVIHPNSDSDDDKKKANDEAEALKKIAEEAAEALKKAREDMRAIEIPVVPKLLADDTTPEALTHLLADHGGRIAVISAEGGIFETIAGRYSSKVNLDVFLKGHAGDTIICDRVSTGRSYIEDPALTVGLMVQPRVIEAIAGNRDFSGRGLLARFLYSMPESKVGSREIDVRPVSAETNSAYYDALTKLASGLGEWQGEPARLTLDIAAQSEMRRIQIDVEEMLGPDGDLGTLTDLTVWGAKLVGAVARIAGLLHLAQWGQDGATRSIKAETILAAEQIGLYFKACAVNVFSNMVVNPETADAIYLLDLIGRLDVQEISERDLFTKASRPRFPSKDDMAPAVKRLVDHGFLIPKKIEPTGGRPASAHFRVHASV